MILHFQQSPLPRNFTVDADPSDTVDSLKCLIEVQESIPHSDQWIFFNNSQLTDHQILSSFGLTDNSLLHLIVSAPLSAAPNDIDAFFYFLAANPMALQELSQQNVPLHQSFTQGLQAFRQKILEQRISQVSSDLVRSGAVATNHEELRKKQAIQEQKLSVYEHHPEAFVRVHMLYIKASINGHPLTLLLDTGAQQSVFSRVSAEKAGIMEYLDRDFAGIAYGVGQQKILGRVHAVAFKMGESFFDHSVTVMEGDRPLMLLGLDFMLRHQAIIDLRSKLFRIGDEGIGFLNENQVSPELSLTPEEASTAQKAQPTNAQPAVPPTGFVREFPREKIQHLKDLGVPEDRAKQLLIETNGNVELAATVFFSEPQ
ncbi:hypothetical protein GEMRC1_003355 [Eukaryota sp. GEM-RC1]